MGVQVPVVYTTCRTFQVKYTLLPFCLADPVKPVAPRVFGVDKGILTGAGRGAGALKRRPRWKLTIHGFLAENTLHQTMLSTWEGHMLFNSHGELGFWVTRWTRVQVHGS